MSELENELPALLALHDFRSEALALRDEGTRALAKGPWRGKEGWSDPGDLVEQSLVVRVLSLLPKWMPQEASLTETAKSTKKNLLSELLKIDPEQLFGRSPDAVPIFRVAQLMQAITSAPKHALSATVFLAYYQILRELHSCRAPDWTFGGASGGPGGPASAFVTGECARAIVSLAVGLEKTAELFFLIQTLHNQLSALPDGLPAAWRDEEQKRLLLALLVELTERRDSLVLEIPQFDRSMDASKYVDKARLAVEEACAALPVSAKKAMAGIAQWRKSEKTTELVTEAKEPAHYYGAESAHRRALGSVAAFVDAGTVIAELVHENQWEKAAARMREYAARLRDTLAPTVRFLATCRDEQLTGAADEHGPPCDVAELVLAASAHALAGGAADSRKSKRALQLVAKVLDDRGVVAGGRPIQVIDKGYKLLVIASQVTRAIADLISQHSEAPDIDVVRRLLRLFAVTDATPAGELVQKQRGWCHEEPPLPKKASWWATSWAVLALDQLVSALSSQINRAVFSHFSVTKYDPTALNLGRLFYGDYGLSAKRDRDSVGVHLQRMRAHLLSACVPAKIEPIISVVLHGPPGTGKTTLIEALATSAGFPLVVVTPSDIVIGGSERAESRMRAVFQALSILTDCVILFDEFDGMLQQRDPEANTPETVFQLLTPGLLPKLRKLHLAAEAQRLVFALATNRLASLDDAVLRKGRFDYKIGVYSPDLVSRTGRLLALVAGHEKSFTPARLDRIARVVAKTCNGAMEGLGKPGWFSPGREGEIGHTVAFVLEKCSDLKDPERMEAKRGKRPKSKREDAVREYDDWTWVEESDAFCAATANWVELTRAIDKAMAT